MGTGSFGGGSGGFGGGGSGGGTGGSGSGGGAKGTDSAHERILKLTKLTEAINNNAKVASARRTIREMLQDRTRSAFLRMTLTDPMLISAYQSLLSIESELRAGIPLVAALAKIGASAAGTLADLTDVICSKGLSAATDERVERIVKAATRDLLMKAVRNDHDRYYETSVERLGGTFDRTPLGNTAGIFLGALIAGAVRADLLQLNGEARAVVGDASREIAQNWTDKFKERSAKKKVRFRHMMQALAEDYPTYVGSGA